MGEVQAAVVELDDAGHQPIDADGHQQGDAGEHGELDAQGLAGHGAEADDDDFRRENEVGTHRALDLIALEGDQVDRGVDQCSRQLGFVGLHLGRAVQQLVRQLLEAFVTEKSAAEHQQRGDRPGRQQDDDQRRRHQNQLVQQRALGHRPDHRQLALGPDPRDLLGIQGQVVAEHAGGLLRGDLGHQRHVVEHAGDIVKQG
ncbi:hypothetical protein FQZ97_906860 [compost metagenome]